MSATHASAPSPRSHRLVLRLYPRWFRLEFGRDLAQHIARQRRESRYRTRGIGQARFWWHVLTDAAATSLQLRYERLSERSSTLRNLNSQSPEPFPRSGVPAPPNGEMGTVLDSILRDLRHAMRGLRQNPGYAFVFILTLGLGIGANTAMFSAVNGVLLRPLPHEDGERLVYLRHSARAINVENTLFSVPEIDDYRQGSPSLAAVAEFSALNFTMLGLDTPRRVRAGIVTGNYFEVMGLSSTLGRTIGREDDGKEASAVIVLSDAYWRQAFGADPEIVGKAVEMNGRIATFVGVAEPAPPYPERTDIYVNLATSPHHLEASMEDDRLHRMTEVFAKLSATATVDSVRAEVDAISDRIHADYPESYDPAAGFGVSVTPLKTQLTSRARPTFLLLLGTAFLVLVIACANLANLTLTRVLRRDHELSIRVSLGGSRATLRRALLIESLLLALAGAAVGLVIASTGLGLLVSFAERFTSRASEISLDASVFGFALLAAVGASVFFTLLPPLPNGDRLGGVLPSGARTTSGSGARHAQRVLVVAQIAVSFVLLIGAGLLVRTMWHLNQVDPGFDEAQVLTMSIPANTAGKAPADIEAQYLSILDGVEALPGVEGAALTSSIPLTGSTGFTTQFEMDVDGHEPTSGAPKPRADFRVVTPGYFESMGIELMEGRDFVTTDLADSQGVVIINATMAKDYFGDRSAIGERIAWTDNVMRFISMSKDFRTVVGVVADTRDAGLDAEIVHTMYNPYRQVTPSFTGSLVIRTTANPEGLMPQVRDVVHAHDPNQPIVNVATIADLGDDSVAPRRLNAMLLAAFATLALVISAVGIGGVLAFSVGSRTKEFGVRSALGAAPHQVWQGVVAEGARLASLGVALGGLGAVFLARFMAGLLVGVPALDPLTFAAVGILLGGVAIAAAWLPAWRAASVSPMEAISAD
ncbi:MAG: FtsX-like permease family protein [Acidobacteria bacterium]|nr:FtsX-like permease family protein [Acidobacteriota bacterium]